MNKIPMVLRFLDVETSTFELRYLQKESMKYAPLLRSKEGVSMVKKTNILLKIVLILGIILSISGCSNKANDVDVSTKVVTKNALLEVTSPEPFAEIPNPVTVKGKSNFFEANTRIRIIDSDGRILADTFTLAEGWTDKLYPFSKEVSYKNTKAKNGYVEVFEESPKDGSEIYKIKIPVKFKIYK